MRVLRPATDVLEGTSTVAGAPRRAWTVAALLGTDAASLAVAALAAVAIASSFGAVADPAALLACLPFVVCAPVAFAVAGLYPGAGLGPVAELYRLWLALAASGAAYLGVVAFVRGPAAVASAPLGLLALALVAVPTGRAVVRELHAHRRWWGVPVVVWGASRSVAEAVDQFQRSPRLGLKPVACVVDDARDGATHVRGVPVVGAGERATNTDPGGVRPNLVVLSDATPRAAAPRLDVGTLNDVAIVAPPNLRSLGLVGATEAPLGRALTARRARTDRPRRVQGAVKRAFDVALALPFAVAALPLIALAALAIAIVSPGTPFYYQVRTGLGGRPIRVWKLRTMYVDAAERLERHLADDPGAQLEWSRSFKLTRDPRILPVVGRFLRVSSIDELPQVFNVVFGDMSFVGPRPFPAYHLAAFDDEFRRLRTTVRPGITGLWQVSARSDGDLDVQRDLDTAYIENWSLGLDLYLLARTPLAVLTARGAR